MVRVELMPWEKDWAEHVGMMRTEMNANNNNARHYDISQMQDNRIADAFSCLAEISVAKYLGAYWDGSYWNHNEHRLYADKPDIPPNIEVRRIREPRNPLVIRRRDADRGRIMVLAYVHDNRVTVDIPGWIEALAGWEQGEIPPWDNNNGARVLRQDALHDFDAS